MRAAKSGVLQEMLAKFKSRGKGGKNRKFESRGIGGINRKFINRKFKSRGKGGINRFGLGEDDVGQAGNEAKDSDEAREHQSSNLNSADIKQVILCQKC